jgi:small conductance mechanosensitive channel
VELTRRLGVRDQHANQRARRARRQLCLLAPTIVGDVIVYAYRVQLFGVDAPVRVSAGAALVMLGWGSARAVGRAAAPSLSRRGIDIAGPVGFMIRLGTIAIALVIALRLVGLDPTTLAAGGAVTAIVVGLAAQQTFGNLFAGIVLLSARPFRIGERIRLQGGALGGVVEGIVIDSGLLYISLGRGADKVLIPNTVVLNSAVVPLREPGAVDLRARVPPRATPTEIQSLLEQAVTTPVRSAPDVRLEEVDARETIVRVSAAPVDDADGAPAGQRSLGSPSRRVDRARRLMLPPPGGSASHDASGRADRGMRGRRGTRG